MGIDFATKEGIEDYARFVQGQMREWFEERGRIPPLAHVITTRSVGSMTLAPRQMGVLTVVPDMMNSAQQKNGFTSFIAELIEAGRAIGVLMVLDTWMINVENPTPEDIAEITRIRRNGQSIEGHRLAREAIFMSLEHIRVESAWQAWITRDASGKPTVHDFTLMGGGGRRVQTSGRFMNLLHKERFA